MRIVVAGAHGQIAQHLGRRLAARGDEVVGLVRDPAHVGDLDRLGVRASVRDLETSGVAAVAGDLAGADAVVFAAGAGPGSGTDRKDSVDRAAAVLLADAAQAAGVRRYVLVSSMGVDLVRDGATPAGVDEVFVAYLRAKLAAEDDVLARDALDVSVLRPGALTDEEPTGRVELARSVGRGSVPRADVADVLVALLDRPGDGEVLELVAGPQPVADAVAAARR
ncbi:NAD(P)H-binding protein [Kineococcus sp. R8]|uniref:NAD(P)H-binding protein n=1 Tax=Kineococcus siccus TaxID=2696567 RepID=UPI001412EBC8|nr:NAD(P)H-binding protein [Kineococcus siccus]NAZ83685.1 NAD(P)H-binding protein [Kineococcus siccus]